MEALSPKPEIEDRLANNREHYALPISLRAVTALEVASVVFSVLITVWGIIPMHPPQPWMAAIPGSLAVALMINSHRVRGETLRELGFTTKHFIRALQLLVLPTLLACLSFAAIGYLTSSFHRSSHFWSTLLILPLWGTMQQYILQGFIYRRVRSLMVDEGSQAGRLDKRRRGVYLAIILTAAMFALVHLPNPTLTGLTFVAGLIWTWVYERAPNLFAIGLSHAMMSQILMISLPPWVLESMSVGYKYFLYQKF
jgi:Type II CAAX prenyl endopeptidase Rce1-like